MVTFCLLSVVWIWGSFVRTGLAAGKSHRIFVGVLAEREEISRESGDSHIKAPLPGPWKKGLRERRGFGNSAIQIH